MKLRVVACGVFEPYLQQLARESSDHLDFKVLDAGLHERPNELRIMLQAEIDAVSTGGSYDAIVLYYGLCGRGTVELRSHDIPIVIPRVHDCISLFLGSSEEYLRQFNRNPGTFYHTLGWVDKKVNPKHHEVSMVYRNYDAEGYEDHPDFSNLKSQFGDDNANYILAFLERWKKNYSRGAYIDLGFDGEERAAEFTEKMSSILGWQHEVIKGDPGLLRHLLKMDVDDPRILVVPPHSCTTHLGDERMLGYSAVDGCTDVEFPYADVVLEAEECLDEPEGIGLGIDAGGTYTDAVIYDLGARKLLAKAKSLTTYHDLVEGIRGALSQLPSDMLGQVQVTSLSTTLATNSIVENRGFKVGLIALCPWDWTEQQIGHSPLINVPGAVAISGEVIEELDEDAARAAVDKLVCKESCAAIVVGGYATIRNPALANRVRDIALEMFDIPVVCSHEVSRRLNAIHGVQTAIANAKLIPIITDLIKSVHQALADFHVPGKLMVVKGDGTPVDEKVARARPVETILSGPAASVSGAKMLTGLTDAMVLDIGGTTTDCAIVENGHVAVSTDGARVGSWVMSVDAVEISTVGLGGDSRIDFDREHTIKVGPMRNIPFCCLADRDESVLAWLNNFDIRRHLHSENASALDVLVLEHTRLPELTKREAQIVDRLAGGPVPSTQLARYLGMPSHALLPLDRLTAWGAIKCAGLTPTDLLHVSGEFTRWHVGAARRALEVFAAMMGVKPEVLQERAIDAVTRRLFDEIIRREVSWERPGLPDQSHFLLDKAYYGDDEGLGVKLSISRPIVAIGAPARALVPAVTDHLNVRVIVPEDADVANAVGAICSETTVREEVLIKPGHMSNYILHGTEERVEFSELQKATNRAIEISRARALKKAYEAGALAPRIVVTRSDRGGSVTGGGKIFLERKVTAIASGAAFGKQHKTASVN